MPKARSRSRLKRPRRPSPDELWWLFWFVWEVVAAVWCYIDAEYGFAVVGVVGACVYWRAYHRARRGVHPALEWQGAALLLSLLVAAFFVP